MLLTIFKYLLPEIFKFLKYANSASDGIIHSTKFGSNMMKADISANLYQKSLILLSTILQNVLHKTSLTVLLPWQQYRVPEVPNNKGFSGHHCLCCDICEWNLICIIQQNI